MASPFDKLYWLRIGCGVLAGVVAYYVFQLPGLDYRDGILVGLFVYLLTYYVARYGWYRKIEADKLTQLYSTGIGGYVMLFLFTWMLLLTLL
ncbi:MAG: hypothetical protein LYZ66_02500 [Nitrososphaerales archaeon]|nr:hypothetical protein [Nitrososphaerales archaeon]